MRVFVALALCSLLCAAVAAVLAARPLAERKEIFASVMAAEQMAREEAERLYPAPDLGKGPPSSEQSRSILLAQEEKERLGVRYKAEVMAKFKLSQDELEGISTEGFTKNWPYWDSPVYRAGWRSPKEAQREQ